MLRLTESGLHQKSRYLNWPRYQTLMNFQRRPPNITKLVRRSFCPFGPDVARRSRNRISEDHKSRKIGTGKKILGGKKKQMIERRDRKRKGGYQIKILALSHTALFSARWQMNVALKNN